MFISNGPQHSQPICWPGRPLVPLFLIQFLFKIDENPLWSSLPPQYIFLIEFLFEIDENPLWSILPPQYIFLIQFLFKIDENPLWSTPPPPVHIPYSILIQNWWKSSLGPLSPSNTYSLFNSYSKLMNMLSGVFLTPPIHTPYFSSYSKLMNIATGTQILKTVIWSTSLPTRYLPRGSSASQNSYRAQPPTPIFWYKYMYIYIYIYLSKNLWERWRLVRQRTGRG